MKKIFIFSLVLFAVFMTGSAVQATGNVCDPDKDLSGVIHSDNKKATITNSSNSCSYDVGLAVYEKHGPEFNDQVLFDSQKKVVSPKQSVNLEVNVPSCAYQIDLFYGDVLQSLDPEFYGKRLIAAKHINGKNYCTNVEPISAVCSVNKSNVSIGESVTFSTSASGGNGSYTYKWTGTDGLSSSNKTVSKSYSSEGTKNASVVITSGTQSITRNCTTVVKSAPVAPICPLVAGSGDVLVKFGERIYSDRGLEGSLTSFKNASLSAGTYKVTLSSYDNHDNKPAQSQPNEKWFVEFWNNSGKVTQSSMTADIPGDKNMLTQVVNVNLPINTSITKVRGIHGAYPDTSTSNSLEAVCALFERVVVEESISGSCSVSASSVETGESVTFSTSASGGNGSYTYKWTGTDGLSSSNKTVSKSYSSEGTKNASVVITSGTQSITRNCTTVIENKAEVNLNVSCIPNGDKYEIGERITWQAIVSGGNGSYTYDWSGTDGLSGTSRTVSQRYDDEGTKRADVTVRSGDGQTKTANCRITIEEEENDDDFEVTCEVSETRIEAGDRVTFDVDIDGGKRPYDIRWLGDYRDIDDFDRDRQRQTVRINEEGRYRLEVEVTDDEGRRASDECRVVIVDDEDEPRVTVTTTNTPTGQVAGVALSQVPYTGLTDNAVLNAILYSFAGLTLLVIGMVSLFILRKRDIVPVFAGKVMTQGQSADYSEDEIVSALEDVAHKNRVIVSAEAMDTLMLRSKNNKVKAMMLLNTAINEVKKDISTDAWLVLSKQKIANVL